MGLVRNPGHAREVSEAGAAPVVVDLEQASRDQVAATLAGADVAVFAAGSGRGSGPQRKVTVDRDAAVLLADAATAAGVPRFVMVSPIAADTFDPGATGDYQIFLRAKSDADAYLRDSDLDWTIVRHGRLTDDPPTGLVTAADEVPNASIPRADVAAVVAAVATTELASHRQFDLVAGETPISRAVAAI